MSISPVLPRFPHPGYVTPHHQRENKIRQDEEGVMAMMAFSQDANNPNYQLHSFDEWIHTQNAHLREVAAGLNPQHYSTHYMNWPGRSKITVDFNLTEADIAKDPALFITHLSSDNHDGTYGSAIRLIVNGQVVENCHVPANHDFLHDEYFDVKKYLHAGKNTVEIAFHEGSTANYWIHKMIVASESLKRSHMPQY
jgi:hypothetical protein